MSEDHDSANLLFFELDLIRFGGQLVNWANSEGLNTRLEQWRSYRTILSLDVAQETYLYLKDAVDSGQGVFEAAGVLTSEM